MSYLPAEDAWPFKDGRRMRLVLPCLLALAGCRGYLSADTTESGTAVSPPGPVDSGATGDTSGGCTAEDPPYGWLQWCFSTSDDFECQEGLVCIEAAYPIPLTCNIPCGPDGTCPVICFNGEDEQLRCAINADPPFCWTPRVLK